MIGKINMGLMLCVFLSVLYYVPVKAEEPAAASLLIPPANRLYLTSLTIARYNPLGLSTQSRLMYSRRLFDSSSPILRDTFFALGPSLKLNPSSVKIGPVIEFQPVAIFNVRMGYEYIRYFGTSGHLQSFAGPDAHYSDDDRADNEDNAYSTSGLHYYIEPTLQLKIGPIAARTKFGFEYFDTKLQNEDSYFYDTGLDTLVPNRELVWTNDSNLLYINGRLTMGVQYTAVMPGAQNRHMRLGPLFAWAFNTDNYTSFNKPTFLMILGWYLEHQNRSGSVPYMLVGFSFTTDFL